MWIFAVSFVRHLWGHPLVSDLPSLQRVSDQLRADFAGLLPVPCPRPVMAGLGVSVQSCLAEVLVQHGVSS